MNLSFQGYNSKKEYIAAQGPLPTTVNEFWRMIWEKHAHTIVMLTKCYEQGRVSVVLDYKDHLEMELINMF